jgi:ribosomal protein L23
MLTEMTHCLARMDAEREAKKEIATAIKEEFELAPKLINKLAATMYKRNYADLQAENEDFEMMYETLVEGKKVDEAA